MRTHFAGLVSRAALIGGAAAVFLAPGALAAQDLAIKNATILTITRGDPISALNSDDLPTFGRPRIATPISSATRSTRKRA